MRFTITPTFITSMKIKGLSEDTKGSLGDTNEKTVTFVGGVSQEGADNTATSGIDESEYVEYTIQGNTPNNVRKSQEFWVWRVTDVDGVRVSTTCERSGGSAGHKVYVLFDTPFAPWNQTTTSPDNESNPWSEALEYSCTWAEGQTTKTGVYTEITKSIFDHPNFQYDGPPTVPGGDGSSRYVDYADGRFTLTLCLSDLGGSTKRDINCSDCGSMMTLFSNIVGGELWSSKMAETWPPPYNTFECNQVVVIGAGAGNWAEPFLGSGFRYHEVGWTGPCGDSDTIFDPCLQVDGNGDPATAPRTEKYPTDMTFSDGAVGAPYDYRESLAAAEPARKADGYDKCLAQPTEHVRREPK